MRKGCEQAQYKRYQRQRVRLLRMAAAMGAFDSRGVGQAAVSASAGGRLSLPCGAYRRGGRHRCGRGEKTLRCSGVRRAIAALGAHRMQG